MGSVMDDAPERRRNLRKTKKFVGGEKALRQRDLNKKRVRYEEDEE